MKYYQAGPRPAAEAARPAQAARQDAGHARRPTTPGWTKLADAIFAASPADAAGAVAAALADGFAPDAIGEAIALAANQLVLRDEGRPKGQTAAEQAGRQLPRRLASASTPATRPTPGGTSPASATRRTTATSLILGAYQVALGPGQPRRRVPEVAAVPAGANTREQVRDVAADEAAERTGRRRSATNDQGRAAALAAPPGAEKQGRTRRRCSPLLRKYAVSARTARCTPRSSTAPTTEEFAAAAGGVPLAATGGPGPRDGQRLRPRRPRATRRRASC